MNTTSIPVTSQLGLAGQADTTSPVAPSKADLSLMGEMCFDEFDLSFDFDYGSSSLTATGLKPSAIPDIPLYTISSPYDDFEGDLSSNNIKEDTSYAFGHVSLDASELVKLVDLCTLNTSPLSDNMSELSSPTDSLPSLCGEDPLEKNLFLNALAPLSFPPPEPLIFFPTSTDFPPLPTTFSPMFDALPLSEASSELGPIRNTRRSASKRKTKPYLSSPPIRKEPVETSKVIGNGREILQEEHDGTLATKYQCTKCETVVGRRPDLYRHYKTCTIKEKYDCLELVHHDGSVWQGCGARFSRRDACFRHLKRRLHTGQCGGNSSASARLRLRRAGMSEVDYAVRLEAVRMAEQLKGWRKDLPAQEKNRLAESVLDNIKQPMFRE